jgi:hypothetical protein
MRIIAKDITGEVYESPEISKESLSQEIQEAYGEMPEDEVAGIYRVVVNSMRNYKNLSSLTINVGTPDEENRVDLNTEHLVYVRVENPITEWEDDDDKTTILDDPRFWT